MSDVDPYPRSYAFPLVSWGSTILGSLVAVITSVMLNLLGAALGIAIVASGQSSSAAASAGIMSVAWVVIANLIALAFGAWVAARAAPNPDHHGGTLQGIAVWALTAFAALFIATSAISNLGAVAMQTANIAANATSATVAKQPQASAQAQSAGRQAQEALQKNAPAVQAGAAKAAGGAAAGAFGTFLAMALGLVAAILGARLGARHPAWPDRPRVR
jgi:hypothetical protein